MAAFCLDHQHEEPCPVCEQDRQLVPSLRLHQHQSGPITDREMWVAIRSGLLAITNAIELFSDKGPLAVAVRSALLGMVSAIESRWALKKRQRSN